MSTYMDEPRRRMFRGRMTWTAHVMADTTEELVALHDRLGRPRAWLQKLGERGEHFDVIGRSNCDAMRAEVDYVLAPRDLVRLVLRKRWPLPGREAQP